MSRKQHNTDLFQLVVPHDKTHAAFVMLRDSDDHVAVRQMMNTQYRRMGDPNGNFVRDFQSEAFHSRVFELACSAYLEASDVDVDRTHESPDFIAVRGDQRVAIEVATTNPRARHETDISVRGIEMLPIPKIEDKCQNEFPIRMGNLLTGKRRKRYWSLPHCKGLPFVIIVGPFHEAGSGLYGDDSLARYLYGIEVFPDWVERNGLLVRGAPVTKHEYAGHSIASNFFGQRQSENISAVIYANSFTVSRFFRIAVQKGLETRIDARRFGIALLPYSTRRDYAYADFDYDTNDPGAPEETWWQGVTVFFNPNARVPLPDNFLPHTSSFHVVDGLLVRRVLDFHPLVSWMIAFSKSAMNPTAGTSAPTDG